MTTEDLYQLFKQYPRISTDTRQILPGSIFFALKGDRFDANIFAEQAIAEGAAYAVVDNPSCKINDGYILVKDALVALQELARYHRKQLSIPVIGLTGTNGKTTTKELINSVLSQKFKTLATQGNLNNHIGVPLTLLTINDSHEMAVIEMGANHQKEIELLCSIAQPTHGLITNIGKAHLEGFGGVEGVKKGKGELYDYLSVSKGVAFVNGDDAVLMAMERARSLNTVILYGMNNPDNSVSGVLTENSPLLSLQWIPKTGVSYSSKTQLTGAYNLDNILAAICIGMHFGIEEEMINKGLAGYQPQNNRSQIKKTATNTLICDYYNANPSSMFVAIENAGKLAAERKVLILGDMFELGEESPAEHLAVINKALAVEADQRVFIGGYFESQKSTVKGQRATFYSNVEEAINGLQTKPVQNSTVLIKGSRGMALERLVAFL